MGIKEEGCWGSSELHLCEERKKKKRRKSTERSLINVDFLSEEAQRAVGMPQSPLSPTQAQRHKCCILTFTHL